MLLALLDALGLSAHMGQVKRAGFLEMLSHQLCKLYTWQTDMTRALLFSDKAFLSLSVKKKLHLMGWNGIQCSYPSSRNKIKAAVLGFHTER